jgi:starch synthase
VSPSLLRSAPAERADRSELPDRARSVLVACPDARPPAYEAVVGLAQEGRLGRFVTGYYYRGHGPVSELARRYAPCQFHRVRRRLLRRNDRRIPGESVTTAPGFDLALALENRLAGRPGLRRSVAIRRTRGFDRLVARTIDRTRPAAAFLFSDVGSEFTLPTCRRLGIATVLSMVHGDVREEQDVLALEKAGSPDYFPLYLGDGRLDRTMLDWLHARRLRDVSLADLILVPSEHIGDRLAGHGTLRERISVVPYAADTRRFRPLDDKPQTGGCTFLFAGGITQRKGIKYLLRAWAKVRRPGWRLQLLGALPDRLGPLADDMKLEGVEHLGRVGHSEMPARMAAADVFVFPSLFEGSAVVTYEALASGLPSIATAASGTVARDGIEGFLVPSRDVDALARRMDQLGRDPAQRSQMAVAARRRAESYDWPRYHAAVNGAVETVLAR